MDQIDGGSASGSDSSIGGDERRADIGRESVAAAAQSAREAAESGAIAGAGGGVTLLWGLREIRRGRRRRGLFGLFLGGVLVTVAIVQRRSTGDREDDESVDVDAETGGEDVDAESTDVESGMGEVEPGAGGEAEAAADESAADNPDASAADSYYRLGGAAFDQQSGRIPAPQRAFNQEFLSLGAEAFWGVRDADEMVVVSQLYDPIADADGVRYVASSQVDEDRMITIPDTVLNHWDELADGGTAVVSGDGLIFVTSDRLQANSQLLVVPEQWIDDVLEDDEG